MRKCSDNPYGIERQVQREKNVTWALSESSTFARFYVARGAGSRVELRNVGLHLTPAGGGSRFGGDDDTRDGLISTRQGNAGSWSSLQTQNPVGTWELQLPGSEAQFRSGAIEDILLVITYGGRTPAWP